MVRARFRRGQRIGKYKLVEQLGAGGFAVVYRARDTIEGRDVALKLPTTRVDDHTQKKLLREVHLAARLEHPNILPIRNADVIGDQLLIAYPLGRESLTRRLQRRLSSERAIAIAEQVLGAVAYAHDRRVIHCDINPSNVILGEDERVMLSDFGLARVAATTQVLGSGSGTVGYVAPEQAMGHPSFRSDVFSLGLLVYRIFSGSLPRWPYEWPPPDVERARKKLTPDAMTWLRRAFEVDHRRRYKDAPQMLRAYESLGGALR